jgi:hypothetical protein
VGLGSLLELQRNEPPTVQVPMEDFPNQLMRRGEEGWHAVEAKLTEIVQVQLPAQWIRAWDCQSRSCRPKR